MSPSTPNSGSINGPEYMSYSCSDIKDEFDALGIPCYTAYYGDTAKQDFNGKNNQKQFLTVVDEVYGTDYQTGNSVLPDVCNPALCCWRYFTDGTKQGDWYVPGCGELMKLYEQKDIINESIQIILNTTDISVCSTVQDIRHWSSSRYQAAMIWSSNFEDGSVMRDMNFRQAVRAFMQI